jgi:DNA-binding transcriptional regulator YiaG
MWLCNVPAQPSWFTWLANRFMVKTQSSRVGKEFTMSYLEQKWGEYNRERNPLRRYSSQREFEADWVNGLRRRYGLSQEALAVMASVSVTTVQNWENPQSRKNIAAHNQDRLRDIERDLWIKSHVTLMEPCPPFIRALYDLLTANKDDSARGLADYLIGAMPEHDPERPRLLHWASLSHSIADPASARAREYQRAALAALGNPHGPLAAAIENEILGSQFEDLVAMAEGPERRQRGTDLMAACQRLFQRDGQHAYLWNALEVACRTPLASQDQYDVLAQLTDLLGADGVRRRVLGDESYAAVRSAYERPVSVN